MPTPPRPLPRLAGVLVVGILLAVAIAGVLAVRPPPPAGADAPADRFSATRALDHVARITAGTPTAGTPAAAAPAEDPVEDPVVDHLVGRLSELGLDTRVQRTVGLGHVGPGSTEMAVVRNVVAVLPGSDPSGRLFLVSHHDAPGSGSGSAGDAAGVAVLLESVRALAQGPQLRNDVVVVLTDARGACRCGAEAFAASHPLAADGGVVLHVAARGISGAPSLVESFLGDLGQAAVPHAVASSFAVEVHRALAEGSDLDVLHADGRFTGMSTALVDGAAALGTSQDVPERLDRASLQALGDNALALARHLGDGDLAALRASGAEDATYFPVLDRLVRYPGSWVGPLAAGAVGAVLLLVVVARARGRTTLPRTALGTLLAAVPLVAGPLAVQGLWSLLVAVRPGYGAMVDPWRPGPYRLAAVAVVVTITVLWYALLRRRLWPTSLIAGGLVWLAALAAVAAAVAPGGSYLAAVPAVAGALAVLIAVLTANRGVRAVAALVAGAASVLVLGPAVSLLLPLTGLSAGAAPAFVVAMLALALLPAFDLLLPDPDLAAPTVGSRLASAAVPLVGGMTAAACAVAGFVVDPFDRTHPAPSELVYVLDGDAGSAWWATTEDVPGPYTAGYVGEGNQLSGPYPYLAGDGVRTGAAEVADLPAPEVVVVSDAEVGERREISVRMTPRRPGVRLITLELTVDGGTIQRARIAGRDVPEAALGEQRLRVTVHAPPGDGLQASVSLGGDAGGHGIATLRVIDGSEGLDGLPGVTPRPQDVAAAGSPAADLVLVSATTRLG